MVPKQKITKQCSKLFAIEKTATLDAMHKDSTSSGKRPSEQAGIKQSHFRTTMQLQAEQDVKGRC